MFHILLMICKDIDNFKARQMLLISRKGYICAEIRFLLTWKFLQLFRYNMNRIQVYEMFVVYLPGKIKV